MDVAITPEEGAVIESGGSLDAAGSFELPELEIGRYELAIRLRAASESIEAAQHRFVVPERCVSADERLGAPTGFGFWTNLYSVRSRANHGFGNLGDLTKLVQWAGREGAAFVGLNPMHALSPGSVCPYQPVSRLFRHPSYLDPEAIPELPGAPRHSGCSPKAFEKRLAQRRGAAQLDAGRVSHALAELLEPANALPQALVLTAIVIGFAVQAFALVLVRRLAAVAGSGDGDGVDESAGAAEAGP